MQEVTGPVIAIVLVLCAVFIPCRSLGGLAGELYRQFAVTIAVSVVISGVWPDAATGAGGAAPEAGARQAMGAVSPLQSGFAWLTAATTAASASWLRKTPFSAYRLRRRARVTYVLFQRIPGSLVPAEDRGYVFMVTVLPPPPPSRAHASDGPGDEGVMKNPAVAHVVTSRASTCCHARSRQFRHLVRDPGRLVAAKIREDARNIAPALGLINANFKDGIVHRFNPPPIIASASPAASSSSCRTAPAAR